MMPSLMTLRNNAAVTYLMTAYNGTAPSMMTQFPVADKTILRADMSVLQP